MLIFYIPGVTPSGKIELLIFVSRNNFENLKEIKMKKVIITIILIIAAYIAFPYIRFMFLSDEGRIAQKIKDAIHSVETSSVSGVAVILAEDFIAEEGMDKNNFKLLLLSLFKSYKEPRIETMTMNISIGDGKKEAAVQYRGKVTAMPENSATAQSQVLEFKFYLKKYDKGGWLIYKYDELR